MHQQALYATTLAATTLARSHRNYARATAYYRKLIPFAELFAKLGRTPADQLPQHELTSNDSHYARSTYAGYYD